MKKPRFSDLGRVEAIKFLYNNTKFTPFKINDFTTDKSTKSFVVSRLFMEGIDFDLTYYPLKHLGYKCITAITEDLFAQLAKTQGLVVKLGISQKFELSHIEELWEGIIKATEDYGYSDISLDLLPSKNGLNISVSAYGHQKLSILDKRQEDNSMDLICISGNIGGAYLGMKVLDKEKENFIKNGVQDSETLNKYKMMISSYLMPDLNPQLIDRFIDSKIIPNRGYVCDRGLADSIKQLVRDSGFGAKVYADKIPFEGNSFELGKILDIDPISAAMNGGEDFRLIFTIPIKEMEKFRHDFQTFEIIGHLAQPEVGAVLVTPDGVELPLKSQGWID